MLKNFFLQILISSVLLLCINLSFAQTSNSRPNILLILTDDMSYKMLDVYNNDTFIHTPNIDRIGQEGAIIKCYSTNSLCIPGRTSILTGKYGHTTGAMNNDAFPPQTLTTIPKILHSQGYYTALCGKWMLGSYTPKPEFDYWLWTPNATTYYNDSARYFDSLIAVTGHMTDLITDSAIQLLSRIDTPFFLMLNYNAPHGPWVPQTQFDSMYDDNSFSLPQNWAPYLFNYPSFLYAAGTNPISTIPEFQHENRNYYEMIYGVEVAIGKILDSLQSFGLLENTMIIFTTDNGYVLGEHRLRGKSLPYEECMKTPLFIRYPEWFQPGTLIDSGFALNIDIAPTILDAAGIADTFNMDGISIHTFFNTQFIRSEFLYEQKAAIGDSLPSVRTFRDNYFQYNSYYCTDTTEELFDMITDPYQKKNLVHHYQYADTLIQYRLKLDSIRLGLNDTALLTSINCHLLNPVYTFEPPEITAFHTNSTCGLNNGGIDVSVTNGLPPYFFSWNNALTTEDLINIASGFYLLTVTDMNGSTNTINIFVNDLAGPVINETHINASYFSANGSINISVTGSSPPFYYLWNTGATTQDLQSIFQGEYSITITDSNGCADFKNITILNQYIDSTYTDQNSDPENQNEISQSTPYNIQLTAQEIILFPNPAYDQLSVHASFLKGEILIEWYNCYGIKIGSTKVNADENQVPVIGLQQLSAGIYFMRIANGNNNYIKTFTVIK